MRLLVTYPGKETVFEYTTSGAAKARGAKAERAELVAQFKEHKHFWHHEVVTKEDGTEERVPLPEPVAVIVAEDGTEIEKLTGMLVK